MRRTSAAVALASLALALSLGCQGPMPSGLGVQAANGQLAPCPDSPNCVSSRSTHATHAVDPFQLQQGDVAAQWTSVVEAVEALPGTVVLRSDDRYAHAESTTRIMRYVDDLELLLDPASGRVDVRSASRVGYGDMGANAARVEALRTLLRSRGLLAD